MPLDVGSNPTCCTKLESKMSFKECDSCNEKLGSPMLCRGCYHNRQYIQKLETSLKKLKRAADTLDEIEERLFKRLRNEK